MILSSEGKLILKDTKPVFKLVAVGDCLPGGRTEKAFIDREGQLILGEVEKLFSIADIVLFNLETPLCTNAAPISKCGPNFRVNPQIAFGLKKVGYTLAALANNHIFDYGPEGLEETIRSLDSAGISHHGAGITFEQATRWQEMEVNDIRVTFLNFAEGEFSRTGFDGKGAAPLDPIANKSAIEKAKEKSDIVILTIHAGNEYMHFPSPWIQNLYRSFIQYGADLVVGHHPHIPQGIECYGNGVIVYSMGDFMFEFSDDTGTTITLALEICFDVKGISSLRIHPIRKNDDASMCFLTGKEKALFINHINRISKPLTDSFSLKNFWEQQVIRRSEAFYLPKLKNNISKLTSLDRQSRSAAAFYYNMFDCASHRQALRTAFNLIHKDEFRKNETTQQELDVLDQTLSMLSKKNMTEGKRYYRNTTGILRRALDNFYSKIVSLPKKVKF